MPSPIAHVTVGYAIYRIFRDKSKENERAKIWVFSVFMIIVVLISVLPDVDSIVGLVMDDLGRFHNYATHSLVVGFVLALSFALAIYQRFRHSFGIWFVIVLVAYEVHIIMDFFTFGRGVMLFWPFSFVRYSSPVSVFYGLRWSDGIFSLQHLVTLFTELVFIAIIFPILRFIPIIKSNQEI